MIRQGDSIENQVTGERLVFIKTSAETNGELVVVEAFVKPSGFVASPHLHPYQEERFEVLAGEVGFQLGKSRLIARPGQCVSVPAGTPHKFWNASDNEEAHFVCSVKPALQFERLIETMFSLAADGKTNRKGMPNPLRLAVVAHAHYDDVRLPFPPEWMQRMGLALGAPLGRLLGYKAIYVPLGAEAALGGQA
jgi:quercetin dioxygenase-like cupin family protein